MMFTANVPNGKTAEPSHLLIRYLSMLPVPPPTNINIICFMFLLFLFMSFFTTVHFYGTVVKIYLNIYMLKTRILSSVLCLLLLSIVSDFHCYFSI